MDGKETEQKGICFANEKGSYIPVRYPWSMSPFVADSR